jgi:hypothetical protein
MRLKASAPLLLALLVGGGFAGGLVGCGGSSGGGRDDGGMSLNCSPVAAPQGTALTLANPFPIERDCFHDAAHALDVLGGTVMTTRAADLDAAIDTSRSACATAWNGVPARIDFTQQRVVCLTR